MTRSPDSTPISSLRTMAFVFLLKISIVLSSGSLWAEGTEETSPPADPPAERCLALVDGEPRDEPMYRTLQIAESMVFVEAPMLSARVAAGELPPVEERVGSDPQVVQPACEVGDYGGTLTGTRSLIGGSHQPIAKWLSPAPFMADGSLGYAPRLYPNVVREWEIADDGRLLTLHLRRGMKWSDGLPVTADDFFLLVREHPTQRQAYSEYSRTLPFRTRDNDHESTRSIYRTVQVFRSQARRGLPVGTTSRSCPETLFARVSYRLQ